MSDWQVLIPQCFDEESLVFTDSADALAAAQRLRAGLRKSGVASELLESEIERWLHTQTSNTGQLFEQMARVRAFLGISGSRRPLGP